MGSSDRGAFHDSFNLRGRFGGDYSRMMQELGEAYFSVWEQEREYAKTGLEHIQRYNGLRKDFQRKRQLGLSDAASMALIKSAALFLFDPFGQMINIRTLAVFRTINLLVYSGALTETDLAGNLLFLGSGDTVPEVAATILDLDIPDVRKFEDAASSFISGAQNIAHHRDYDLSPLIPSINSVRETTLVADRKASQGRKIVAVEPDDLLRARIPAMKEEGIWVPDMYLVRETLAAFLAKKIPRDFPTSYSLTASFRTEPRIWGQSIDQGVAEFDMSDVGNVINNPGKFIDDSALLKFSDEVPIITKLLLEKLISNGKLLVTVGHGGSGSEFGRRALLAELVAQGFLSAHMNPKVVTFPSLQKQFPHWPDSVEGDYSIITGEKTRRAELYSKQK